MELDGLSGMRNLPLIDIFETDGALSLRIDLPGVTLETLSINATENTLEIQARRDKPPRREYEYHQENRPLFLDTTLPVPPRINATAATATLERGVLTLTLPKKSGTQTTVDIKHQED